MKVEMPQNSTLRVKVGDLEFRLTHASHMKGESFFIMNMSPGEVGPLYEKERTHAEVARDREHLRAR